MANKKYSDVDECQEDIDGCSQACSNIVGSYVCSCYAGYRLTSDRHRCIGMMGITDKSSIILCKNIHIFWQYTIDINECSENVSGCAQLCHNTVGSYTCSCDIGYQLSSNNHSCEGMHACQCTTCIESSIWILDLDECSLNTDDCMQTCNNTIGSFQCGCFLGYELNNDSTTCRGI